MARQKPPAAHQLSSRLLNIAPTPWQDWTACLTAFTTTVELIALLFHPVSLKGSAWLPAELPERAITAAAFWPMPGRFLPAAEYTECDSSPTMAAVPAVAVVGGVAEDEVEAWPLG